MIIYLVLELSHYWGYYRRYPILMKSRNPIMATPVK